jgi:aspartate kinase
VLVAGFQGVSTDTNDVTTLGRGGTDATAVALAAALGAACEIYSDVAGVYTSDPRIVPGARKLPRISYEEMLEMSASGAKVLMLRSVELARNHNVRVHSRSTFSQEEGTWIVPAEEVMEHPIISGVTHSQSEVIFTLTGIPDRPGAAATVFDSVAAEHVNVDTIIQNVVHGVAELSFSVPHEDVPGTRRALALAEVSLGPLEVEENDAMGKVSLIGAGMRSHPGVTAKFFGALAEAGVNIQMITTSEIRISVVVGSADVDTAVIATHKAFDLDAAEVEAVVYGGTGR